MAPPLWMQIVAQNRQRFSPAGAAPRTFRVQYNATPLEARGVRRKGRGGGRTRTKKEYPEGPEGVIERLQDQGFSDSQIDAVLNEDKGGGFDPFSPNSYLKAGGDVLGGVLNTLDVGRAYTVSGLNEVAEGIGAGLDKIPGVEFERSEESDRFKQSGVSWRDFVENAQNRVTFGDIIEATPEDAGGLNRGSNEWLKLAAGLGVDIAADPLNYVGVGLADDATKVAKMFRDPGAIKALGKNGADEAARKVLQEGVNALGKDELAAIGRKGGLYIRSPGTGAVGRTLKLDKLMGNPERYVTLAARGTKVGDAAAGAARGVRKLGFNAALRKVGGGAAARGLAGNLGPLRAAERGLNQNFSALDALVTRGAETKGRHLAKSFETRMMNEWRKLHVAMKAAGADGQELFHAVGGTANRAAAQHPQLVNDLANFLEEVRSGANTLAGREYTPFQQNYVPRVWTDEAREMFGIPQAKGKGGTRSLTRKRSYLPGTTHTFGKGKNAKTLKLEDPIAIGKSVEQQIEDFLVDNDMTSWFKDDAFEVIPDYIKSASRQLKDEAIGEELKQLDVGEELWQTLVNKPPKTMGQQRLTQAQTGLSKRKYQRLTNDLAQAEAIVQQHGRKSAQAKALPWPQLYRKAKTLGADWEPVARDSLKDLFKQTGEKWAQFGTSTALPADMVTILRDIGRMSEPDTFPRLMKLHDKLLNGWKKLALLSPGYHWRNSFGGVWMNSLADMDEGRYLQFERLVANDPDAEPFFSKGARITKGPKGARAALRPINDPELLAAYDAAKKYGFGGGGQSLQEIDGVDDLTELRGALRVLGAPVRGSRKVGGAIENRLRGALFIDEFVKTGGDEGAALDKVLKYHFDYEALGRGPHRLNEASIRRMGIPFYTFTRRSVPLMLEHIVRNPGKINRYFQLKNNIERYSKEEGILPEYFERNFAIRMPWMDDGNQTYMMPDLPLFSLVDAGDPNQALSQISPMIKTPMELATGKQIYKGIPLEGDPVEPPGAVRFLMPALRALGRTSTDAKGNEVISERDLYALQQFLPQIGQYRRLFPTEDKYEERRMTSVLSFLFGVGMRTNTEREQANEVWRRYDPYADDVEYQKKLGFEQDDARAIAFE